MSAKERLQELLEAEKATVTRLEQDLRSSRAKLGALQQSVEVINGDDTTGAATRKIQALVRKEAAAVTDSEQRLMDAAGRISAFEEAIKVLPKEGEVSELRPGSQLAEIRDMIRGEGKPMTLREILERKGWEHDEGKRNSIRGSISGYAREGRVFTKEEAPDTFGLIEFRKGEEI